MIKITATVLLIVTTFVSKAAESVDFVRDIRPILNKACLSCHGPEKQKNGYRVDVKEIALKGGDTHGVAIVPGKSAESPLIQYVSGKVEDMLMPPKGDRLTVGEIDLLKKWIDQGAVWPANATANASDPLDWWSLRSLRHPKVPEVSKKGFRILNPVDAFVATKLIEKGLTQSPEADRRTLIRRLYFDLTGLPPSLEEVDRFVADKDPKAYEKLVDQLLDSPRYGERWARHWLDVAHYGDTHGYDKDKARNNAWPYRDYVIRSFNEDKPYSRFVQEQIAGDVLFPFTRDGAEALGFIAAGPWDLIGHSEVPETKTDGKIARLLDRDDMVSNSMNTFVSLTVQCARCHNHKFDPVSQEDYYSLQAVFAALDRTDKPYDKAPDVARIRHELQFRDKELSVKSGELKLAGEKRAAGPLKALDERIAALGKPSPAAMSKADAYGYHSQISDRQDAAKWVQVDLGKSMTLGRVVLQPCKDDFNQIGEGFGFPVRFKVEACDDLEFKTGVSVVSDQTGTDLPNPKLSPVAFPLNGLTARYLRVTATKLAPRKNDFIFALSELQVIDVTEQNVAAGVTVTSLDSIEAPPRWRKVNLVDGYFPGANKSGEPDELARLQKEREALVVGALTDSERVSWDATRNALAAVRKEIAALPKPSMVYAGTIQNGSGAFRGTGPDGGRPRVIQVLHRGDVLNPKQVVGPGTAPVVRNLPSRFEVPESAPEGDRRAALARWMTDLRNPLAWRSIVNRVWQFHFGRGLVETPNDFGRMGQLPTHPELLDWLAADFRESGQSIKRLHRQIVLSATYRQSSAGNAKAATIDGGNAFLWRQNRRKLEAEAIRDSVLLVSGKLDLKMGGPGFQDFVVDKPQHSPHYEYQLHDPEDPATHRRSIYRFIVRSQPQPFMTVLDCADPSMSVDKRNETQTALQALALLNNRLMVVMAKHFADRAAEAGPSLETQIDSAYRIAFGRNPTAKERRDIASYARVHGMANACRLMFNLNEFVFVD
ncbi:MAG TPA: DUF1553 domain-containing protein [Roseimicrobium sp.]|nr:DUF1553 domain-containing protein [Roseimicrobium sp.]